MVHSIHTSLCMCCSLLKTYYVLHEGHDILEREKDFVEGNEDGGHRLSPSGCGGHIHRRHENIPI